MTLLPSANSGPIVALLFRRVGDSLLATPALRALKQKYPDRMICVVAEPQTSRVFEGLTYVDEVLECPRSPSPFDLAKLMRRRGTPAATLDFLSDPRSAIACYLSGAKMRIGIAAGVRSFLYSQRVARQDERAPVYSAIHKLRLAECLEANSTDFLPDFALTSADTVLANEMWSLAGLPTRGVVALFISSRRPYKRWPLESFSKLVAGLRERGVSDTILIGGANEEQEMRTFAQNANLTNERVMACTNLGVLAALLKRVSLFIGNDGGPKHLACAVGTATVTIFRHDPPEYWTPPQNPRHLALRSDDGSNTVEVLETALKVYRDVLA